MDVTIPIKETSDGDTVSVLAVYSKQAIDELNDYFKKRKAYTSVGGGMAFSVDVHTTALVLNAMTGDPRPTA